MAKRATCPAQADLIERLRQLIADAVGSNVAIREVSMFGGRSFMVHEKLAVSALTGGDLLVRIAADHHDRLVALPGATSAEMGAGRVMGPGWIHVSGDAIADAESLAGWLDRALEYNRLVSDPPR